MVELTIKGEVLKVYNMQVSDLLIDTETNNVVCRLLKDILGRDVRITKIEEHKGKRVRNVVVIESQ